MSKSNSLLDHIVQDLRDACAATFLFLEAQNLIPQNSVSKDIDPLVRYSDHADFQANVALSLAKKLQMQPRELAQKIIDHLSSSVISATEVSGPGFINITIADEPLIMQINTRFNDERLGIGFVDSLQKIVIDYAAPNVAKEMHVGHLRSSVLGDCLAKVLAYAGHTVIPRHHIGDWGTAFGMLTEYLIDTNTDIADSARTISAITVLNNLYKSSRSRFDADHDFADRSRKRVVLLQSGDEQTLRHWKSIVNISVQYFFDIFHRLNISIDKENIKGESYYNPELAATVELLIQRGVAVESEGALCVFFDEIKGKDGTSVPLIVRKSDGGFGYAATDLAAIRDRVDNLHAQKILYVVDARQSLHFKMVFDTAYRAGFVSSACELRQIPHGAILGKDGKPLKTRDGESALLVDLVDAAIAKAESEIRSKSGDGLSEERIIQRAIDIGVGAVKYSDISTSLGRDYIFDLDSMLNLQGNTSVYIQYAYARIQSILRNNEDYRPVPHGELKLEPSERALALIIDECSEIFFSVVNSYEPHRLAHYLYQLAVAFTSFYDVCSIKHAPDDALKENRLLLAQTTGRILMWGLELLGIAVPDQL